MSWQPFRTAPRDGTAIIVCTAVGAVGEAYWDAEARQCCWANLHFSDFADPEVHDPRYWQPMPEPPAELRGGR